MVIDHYSNTSEYISQPENELVTNSKLIFFLITSIKKTRFESKSEVRFFDNFWQSSFLLLFVYHLLILRNTKYNTHKNWKDKTVLNGFSPRKLKAKQWKFAEN